VPPVYEMVWKQLAPRIVTEILKELRPRVPGAGGMAQADASLPVDTVRVSKKLGRLLRGVSEATIMYWPSKFPHCLHRVKVEVDDHLDGSVIVVHPEVLETLGGDCDGDLIYLITEPSIVAASRSLTDPVTITDRISGEKIPFTGVIDMIREERRQAAKTLDLYRRWMEQQAEEDGPAVDGHMRLARVNESAGHIGLAFVVRDLVMDAARYDDDRLYVRLGMLCQEALDGLKLTTPVDIVQAILQAPDWLAQYLRMPASEMAALSMWQGGSRVRVMYRALSDKRVSLSYLAGAAHAASRDAASLFEWILARTGLGDITVPEPLTGEILRHKAEELMHHLTPEQVSAARYHLARSRSLLIREEEGNISTEHPPGVTLQDHRYGRVQHLLSAGVSPTALRAVIMDHVARHAEAVEALGLLTALRCLQSGHSASS
jgi:hypothetical protein